MDQHAKKINKNLWQVAFCMIFVILIIILSAIITFAEVNVSTSFAVTFDGQTHTYAPGTQVKLYADATNEGKVFSGFNYDVNAVPYPGIFYDQTDERFIFTFLMPACDLSIESVYDRGWTVKVDGASSQSTIPSATGLSGYYYIDYDSMTLTTDNSGQNLTLLPGNATVKSYSGDTYNVDINGSIKQYAASQPIVITEPYVYNENSSQVVDGYEVNGVETSGSWILYTDLNTGTIYRQTTLTGVNSDTSIVTHTIPGCRVTAKDTLGNSFGSFILETGNYAKFAIPTMQGDYCISNITAIDDANAKVPVEVISQTDGNSILTVAARTSAVDITFKWHNTVYSTPDIPNDTPVTTYAHVLDAQIKSSGLITSYNTNDPDTPMALIDADDIQKNRDMILDFQNQLSGTGRRSDTDYSDAIYFFHNPTITHENGQTEKLSGYFMQKGSSVPMDNETWLQIG